MKNQTARRQKRRIVPTILLTLLLFLGFLCFFAARWYCSAYGKTGFDSILFTLFGNLGGVESGLLWSFAGGAVLPAAVCTALLAAALFWGAGKVPLPYFFSAIAASVLALCLIVYAAVITEMPEYIYGIIHPSEFIEEEYVDPNDVEITFPEEKRNLIYIFLESMEVTYFSQEQGGAEDTCLIPELYALAEENINFSNNSSVGGFRSANGTTWTIGAMVGQTSGVPLKTPDNVDDWQNGYGTEGVFLPGLTTLSDILHENGYYQSLMVGSSASFGGRKTYYSTHGTDTIYELSTARADGIVASDYFVWWGMEDKYLFQYAKQELLEIAAQEQPFAFTMLTVDTHHIGGYVCEYCGEEHEEQYENVISCSSRQVAEFVEWIQQQDFYENTTIIICGDHPSMDNGYFERNIDDSYTRRVYNCFINSAVDTAYSKNREFTTLDLFPTTLAAIGCTIEGERLGLGVNLFSGQPTLAEQLGTDLLNSKLSASSDFYARVFRQESTASTETEG